MSGGNGHVGILTFASAPQRVVSLVPSITDSLFALGVGDHLVGVTDFCQPPEAAAASLARVGGTRDTDVAAVLALDPDLVLANQEENSLSTVEALEERNIKVWVTFPRSIQGALDVLWALVRLFRIPDEGAKIRTMEITLDWTRRASEVGQPVRIFCPIWHGRTDDGTDWWMTFNRETYANDVLACCGGANLFADRRRRYPLAADLRQATEEDAGGRDTRYPRLAAQELSESRPEMILLPDEPMAFSEEDEALLRRVLAGTPAVEGNRIRRLDGRLLSWHGTMLARALDELPGILQSAEQTASSGSR